MITNSNFISYIILSEIYEFKYKKKLKKNSKFESHLPAIFRGTLTYTCKWIITTIYEKGTCCFHNSSPKSSFVKGCNRVLRYRL